MWVLGALLYLLLGVCWAGIAVALDWLDEDDAFELTLEALGWPISLLLRLVYQGTRALGKAIKRKINFTL